MRKCIACKNAGRISQGTHKDAIYHSRGEPTILHLCYGHSVELFKTGQTNFVSKHCPDPLEYETQPKPVANLFNNYFAFNSFR